MQYKKTVETKQYQPMDLLGNLGGVLGLWLGISLMTFVELVELIYNMVYTFVKFLVLRKQNYT